MPHDLGFNKQQKKDNQPNKADQIRNVSKLYIGEILESCLPFPIMPQMNPLET